MKGLSPVALRPSRESAMELLRILAMLMVLIVHADYAALGVPSANLLRDAPTAALCRVGFEQLAIVGVNTFVLISGWFGIRTTLRGVCNLLFQVVFYALAVAGIYAAVKGIPPAKTAMMWLSFLPGADHWFIRSYLGLMILAPVINVFLQTAPLRREAMVVAAFFLFEFIYGWWLEADGFNHGYSLLSLIGLYMLGHLARRCGWQRWGSRRWLALWAVCAAIATAVSVGYLVNGAKIPPGLTAYDSPLVTGGALSLTLVFAAMRPFSSRAVNGVALSCLAVYLIHFNPFLFHYYLDTCRYLYRTISGPLCFLAITGFITAVFAASVIIDRLRLLLWGLIRWK